MVDIVSLITVSCALMAAFSAGVWGWAVGRKSTEVELRDQIDSGFKIIRHALANDLARKQAEQHFANKPKRGV